MALRALAGVALRALAGVVLRTLAGVVLLAPVTAGAAVGRWSVQHHTIDVTLDPAAATLLVQDAVRFADPPSPDAPLRVLLHQALRLQAVEMEGKTLQANAREGFDPRHFWPRPDYERVGTMDLAREIELAAPAGGWPPRPTVRFRYAGSIVDSLRAPPVAYARGMETTRGIVTDRGVYLAGSSFWVPFAGDGTFTFQVTGRVPRGWETVSQGERAAAGVDDAGLAFATWRESHPMEEVYLIAGPYTVRASQHAGVSLYTFTYADTPEPLCQTYLDATGRYLDLYGGRIGKYPFAKFALVENWWQTGFGMPSFTLLGDKVIRLPFIVNTSYGHEILHNWWGNGVFVDYQKGNWCEGLTTYLADHLYKEQEGAEAARDYRQAQLQGYLDYAAAGGRDFPLREFRERESFSTQAVGYGKTMMVFHMLRRRLGDAGFDRGLQRLYADRKFQEASWDDIAHSFEQTAGEPLAGWFEQWIGRPGAPRLSAELLDAGPAGCTVRLLQDEPAYDLRVPVRFTRPAAGTDGESGPADTTVVVALAGTQALVRVSGPVTQVVVDPECDLFRLLDRAEIPPTLSQTLGADSTLVVIGSRATAVVADALRALGREWAAHQNMMVVEEAALAAEPRPGRARYLLGPGEAADAALALAERQFGPAAAAVRADADQGVRSIVATVRDPADPRLSWTVVLPASAEVVPALGRKLPHYGKYSTLAFEGEQNVAKGVWTVLESPLRLRPSVLPGRPAPAGGR